MKRRVARTGTRPGQCVAAVMAAMLALGITPAFGAGAGAGAAKAKPTVKIASTYVGPLLVNKAGYTIYMFARDKRNKDVCVTIKKCEKDWPAVTTTTKPIAGPGVKKALLGTIPYRGPHKGKVLELTYKGRPLHTYRYDTSKASVINIGNRQFHGAWYGLNAKGGLVK